MTLFTHATLPLREPRRAVNPKVHSTRLPHAPCHALIVIRECSLAKIAQVDTRATSRDAHKYKSSCTPRNQYLILNLPSSLLNRRRISRLVSRDHSSPMSAPFDRFDAAKIYALVSVDAIPVEDARKQLQSHSAFDVMIEGRDQRFTDSIIAKCCAPPRLFFERTLARLPPTLGGVYLGAMIACDETPVRCEKQLPEGTLSVALVFCFRIRSYYAARCLRDVQPPIRIAPYPGTTLHLLRDNPAQMQRRACRYCGSVCYRCVEFASPPTHYDTAIPAVVLEYRPLTTHPDSLFAPLDSRLGFFRVRCVVLWRCASLVLLANRN